MVGRAEHGSLLRVQSWCGPAGSLGLREPAWSGAWKRLAGWLWPRKPSHGPVMDCWLRCIPFGWELECLARGVGPCRTFSHRQVSASVAALVVLLRCLYTPRCHVSLALWYFSTGKSPRDHVALWVPQSLPSNLGRENL